VKLLGLGIRRSFLADHFTILSFRGLPAETDMVQ
jgi:hypothetical protein